MSTPFGPQLGFPFVPHRVGFRVYGLSLKLGIGLGFRVRFRLTQFGLGSGVKMGVQIQRMGPQGVQMRSSYFVLTHIIRMQKLPV